MYEKVQGKVQFSMQMSSNTLILFSNSHLVSTTLRFIDYECSAFSNISQYCYLADRVIQVIEHLPSKPKSLSSKPSTTKKQKNNIVI
jgi:hypothetical protein